MVSGFPERVPHEGGYLDLVQIGLAEGEDPIPTLSFSGDVVRSTGGGMVRCDALKQFGNVSPYAQVYGMLRLGAALYRLVEPRKWMAEGHLHRIHGEDAGEAYFEFALPTLGLTLPVGLGHRLRVTVEEIFPEAQSG